MSGADNPCCNLAAAAAAHSRWLPPQLEEFDSSPLLAGIPIILAAGAAATHCMSFQVAASAELDSLLLPATPITNLLTILAALLLLLLLIPGSCPLSWRSDSLLPAAIPRHSSDTSCCCCCCCCRNLAAAHPRWPPPQLEEFDRQSSAKLSTLLTTFAALLLLLLLLSLGGCRPSWRSLTACYYLPSQALF
jgi:hypothetical protein